MSFCVSTYIILNSYKEYKDNEDATKELITETIEVNEETKEKEINWDYLKSTNEDIVGWIEIEGTNINYPILKDKNNFYLKHSFNGEYNSSGSIFTTNLNPFEDDETIIYGHNMKNGSMFSELGKYMNADFLKSHQKFKIYLQGKNYEATIFSAYSISIDDENKNIKVLDFDERIDYYKTASRNKVEFNEEVSKIVKLSTCSYENAKYRPTEQRYYIVANIVEK